jgi:hypothetical protein
VQFSFSLFHEKNKREIDRVIFWKRNWLHSCVVYLNTSEKYTCILVLLLEIKTLRERPTYTEAE